MKYNENISVKKAIEIGIEAGLKKALEEIEKEKIKKKKQRYDRRLRNTDLLLKNYNNFVAHCENAIYTRKQLLENNAIDILDECEDLDYETYVKAIMRTKERTAIIVNHIKNVLEFYKFQAEKSREPERIRRVKVIKAIYFDKKKYEEIAEEMSLSVRTVKRDKKTAIAEISTLVFGIDGLKFDI
ncbi:sigma factor-like helix-turn-helix DNA-binding protein [Caloranaerobacter azorensis]|uniref:Uncharacterized protein n=1 Tax=Caloranaerobacter azorensis TaxID=116090 RepID=A0A6P1YDM0_9FIRM|nr:sigma factor-like helix-turn-helix DNA-binding protein [Caloranaerobacter azorensis]QIB26086.1 hypothetical protein G3A45_01430 [Caloranaerobacter azorensis]